MPFKPNPKQWLDLIHWYNDLSYTLAVRDQKYMVQPSEIKNLYFTVIKYMETKEYREKLTRAQQAGIEFVYNYIQPRYDRLEEDKK